MNQLHMRCILGIILISSLTGCVSGGRKENPGQVQMFDIPQEEAGWILKGEPIKYEGEIWYPQDGVESLKDSEVYLVGEYEGVQFFVDKVDVKPYNRLYTKFGRNKFRIFEKEEDFD